MKEGRHIGTLYQFKNYWFKRKNHLESWRNIGARIIYALHRRNIDGRCFRQHEQDGDCVPLTRTIWQRKIFGKQITCKSQQIEPLLFPGQNFVLIDWSSLHERWREISSPWLPSSPNSNPKKKLVGLLRRNFMLMADLPNRRTLQSLLEQGWNGISGALVNYIVLSNVNKYWRRYYCQCRNAMHWFINCQTFAAYY